MEGGEVELREGPKGMEGREWGRGGDGKGREIWEGI